VPEKLWVVGVAAFQRGPRRVAAVGLVGLAATGIVLSHRSPESQTWSSRADTSSVLLSLEHLLVIVMVLLLIARSVVMPRPARHCCCRTSTSRSGSRRSS
jgi:hypothetical protein